QAPARPRHARTGAADHPQLHLGQGVAQGPGRLLSKRPVRKRAGQLHSPLAGRGSLRKGLGDDMKGNLNERAMLVTLHTSVWTARKHDKRVSKEVSDAHGASENAGRYNKRLLPQDAKCYKDVTAADTFAVSLHKEQTLPWLDTCYGQRILPVTNFLPYSQKIRGARERFENAVRIFVGQYDALREEARTHLNGMFDPDDYPSAAEINGKFKFSTSTMPLPVADDFRCQLAEAEMDSIRSQIQVSV